MAFQDGVPQHPGDLCGAFTLHSAKIFSQHWNLTAPKAVLQKVNATIGRKHCIYSVWSHTESSFRATSDLVAVPATTATTSLLDNSPNPPR